MIPATVAENNLLVKRAAKIAFLVYSSVTIRFKPLNGIQLLNDEVIRLRVQGFKGSRV